MEIKRELKDSITNVLLVDNPEMQQVFINLIEINDLSIESLKNVFQNDNLFIAIDIYNALLFKGARLTLRMSQADISKELGWSSVRQVTNIENNKRPIQKQTKLAIELLVSKSKHKNELLINGFNKNCWLSK